MDTPEKELTAPEAAEDFESIYAEIYDEFGEKTAPETAAAEELSPEEPVEPQRNAYADRQNQAAPLKPDHSIRFLTILIILELLGIAGVAAWWILRLL